MVLCGRLNERERFSQNLKWVGSQGNCTGLVLEDIQFPGAKEYFCGGALSGESSNCSPQACHLNASSGASG
jgi:hypothetical protein